MSDRIGPMAWGSQGQVFLGEDLMHTRDYSDETSRVIDEEVERILRTAEDRAMEVLRGHRGGLEAVAAALLDKETIDGSEVGRLVDEADRLVRAGNGDGAGAVPTAPLADAAAQPAPPRAPDALAPDALAPDALAPDALAPDALAPDALAPPPVVTTGWPGATGPSEATG